MTLPHENALSDLFSRKVDAVCVCNQDGCLQQVACWQHDLLLFPGSFNPLHHAHRAMTQIAAELCGKEAHYELSIQNVDKPPLEEADVVARLTQFAAGDKVWLSHAAAFRQKAKLFPGATFLVGADTIERVADNRYYPGGNDERAAAIADLATHGCRFLVFGRLTGGRFMTLADVSLPASLSPLCTEVPASQFRVDVSSTELRRGASP